MAGPKDRAPKDAAMTDSFADTFAENGYLVMPGLLEPVLAAYLWQYLRMKGVYGLITHRDRAVPKAMSAYSDEAFEALLETVRPRIEVATGLSLHAAFSYVRLYRRGDTLRRHRDRPACEVTVSINLGQIPDVPWALHVSAKKDDAGHAAMLMPGDGLIYRGIEMFHWRDSYEGQQLGQVFLHYVDRNGPHAEHKYDRRARLMLPRKGNYEPHDV
jgi:hypothetical protein